MPQLDVATYSSQIFWLIVCLSLIYIGLRYIFIPKLENSIEARKIKIQKMLHEAEKLRYEASILDQKYAEEIKSSYIETYEFHKNEIKKLEEEFENDLRDLSQEQDKKFDSFKKEISEIEKKFKKEIEQEANVLLDNLVEKFSNETIK